jgi:Uma2 family endonuclease
LLFFGNRINVVADLAVEVISPHDDWEEVTVKALEFIRDGVRLVWVISPRLKELYAYNTNPSPHVYTESDTLDGGDVMPGFAVNVGSRIPPVEMNAPAS